MTSCMEINIKYIICLTTKICSVINKFPGNCYQQIVKPFQNKFHNSMANRLLQGTYHCVSYIWHFSKLISKVNWTIFCIGHIWFNIPYHGYVEIFVMLLTIPVWTTFKSTKIYTYLVYPYRWRLIYLKLDHYLELLNILFAEIRSSTILMKCFISIWPISRTITI